MLIKRKMHEDLTENRSTYSQMTYVWLSLNVFLFPYYQIIIKKLK